MAIDMSQFFQVFFEESAEHLAEMEHMLLQVDVDTPDIDDLNAIFRAAHSIKGGSGTFGFTDMTEVTHVLETLLDRLRKSEMQPRTEMIDAFLIAVDVLKGQLHAHINGTEADRTQAEEIIKTLNALSVSDSAGLVPLEDVAPLPESAAEAKASTVNSEQSYYILFTAPRKFAKKDEAIAGLISNLGQLGTLETLRNPAPKSTDKDKKKKHKDKLLAWEFRLIGTTSENAIRDVFSFFAGDDQVQITLESTSHVAETPVDNEGYGFFTDIEPALAEDEGFGFFGDIPVPENNDQDPGYGFFDESPAQPTSDEDGYGFFQEIVPPALETPPPTVAKAPETTKEATVSTTPKAAAVSAEATSIRVGVEKVDQLINLVGELVITQAMLAQTASMVDPVLYEALNNGLNQLERNTRDLQESVMSIRMMPISFVFNRFPRVVRDLASKLNKQIELVTVGENTELDKGLIEKIADPLTHLVRNSLDHGIELPEKRIAAGKPAKGTVTLSASHQGGAIVIEVADDGAGLNREKILAKAAERGLPVSDSMTDAQVWQLIFAPGFSTADVITDVSGRGVGMDVVIRNITEMGGAVEIESVYGWGTKMTVRLPLTLAILDGMTVSVGDAVYVIPLNLIVETLQPNAEDVRSVTGQGKVVHVRGEYLPLIALHELFNTEPQYTDPTKGVLIMIEDKGKKAALFIDTLLGQQQVVIKSLETNYRKVQGISGATIMGDGRVALIIDVPAIIKMGATN